MQLDSHRIAAPPKGKILTPSVFVQLPRPSAYSPNPSGTLALAILTQYNHSKQHTSKSLMLLKVPREGEEGRAAALQAEALDTAGEWTEIDVSAPGADTTGHETLVSGLKYTEYVWADDETVLFLRPPGAGVGRPDLDPELSDKKAKKALERRLEEMEDGDEETGKGVEVWAKVIGKDGSGDEYKVGTLPTEVGDLKWVSIPPCSAAAKPQSKSFSSLKGPIEGLLAFSAEVYPPYTSDSLKGVHKRARELEEQAEGSTGQTYDGLFVRHWDEWKDSNGKQNRVFVVRISKGVDKTNGGGKWVLGEDVMAPGANLEAEVPVGPFGGADDFDIAADAFACTAKDPSVNPAWHTRQNIYVVPLFPRNADEAKPRAVTSGVQGATSCPTFCPNARSGEFGTGCIAWLEMRSDGYESDRNRVMLLDLSSRIKYGLTEDWDRSPTWLAWSADGKSLYLKAEDAGHVKLWILPIVIGGNGKTPTPRPPQPLPITHAHTISGAYPLPLGGGGSARVLITESSYTTPNTPHVLLHAIPSFDSPMGDPPKVHRHALPSLVHAHVSSLGLSYPESFYFPGAGGHEVHGFLHRPAGYAAEQLKQSGKKWPLAFLIHGGPQGAWTDGWSWRWHPAVYAAAGYITVAINPTGSTGYGQAFTDAINQDWGGKPYQDLVSGYQYLLDNYPEIDAKRTAALGASYGGYMVNWLMGHNPGFSAFVCHDGVFSPINTWYATEELYFPEHDLGGTPYEVPANYQKWNPQAHIDKWSTPCLVIHNRLDFRLPESEGLGVFNTLQRRGIPSRFLYFPDENHWVTKPANSLRWHTDVLKWINEWTSDDAVRQSSKSGYSVAYQQ